jgi:hypothetical protein
VPVVLELILAASWIAARPRPERATSKAARRALARLEAAARSNDSSAFFAVARSTLLQTFADRWGMCAEQITTTDLRSRLGTAGEDLERLVALADEVQYSHPTPDGRDFQRWLELVRSQLANEGP